MATRKTPAAKTPATAQVQRALPAAAAKAPAKPTRAAKVAGAARAAKVTAKAAKPDAPKKAPKLRLKPVRDSFTMPEADFALIATLKARALAAKRETKKSELLRAGLHALALLDTTSLVAALGRLQPVKIGRPKSGH